MATISIIRVENPAEKAEISARILHALPDWFGLPDSTQKYIDDSRNMPFFAAVREGQAVGFAALKATSPCAGEIYVMGVLPEYHRSGIGQQLFAAIRAEKEGISAFCGEYIEISAEKEATLWPILARQSKKSGNRA